MTAADVYAMPSFGEPFGLVFAEAMAASLPVVAVGNGGTPEVVQHGVTGLLSAPDDDEALAADLLRLLGDPALRDRMGATGRARVEAEFRLERQAADMAAVYDRLLDSH
jgi:glycosyltransferase involved in cell wall biosynthesis